MSQKTVSTAISMPTEYLRQEYEIQHHLFEAQPVLLQRYFEAQARTLAESLLQKPSQVKFSLPDRVVVDAKSNRTENIAAEDREQMAGGLVERLTRTDLTIVLRARFKELEQLPKKGVAAAAGILRYTTCRHMVTNMLPVGRSVKYVALEGETTPSEPESTSADVESAITASTDAIAEESGSEMGRGELQVPFVPYARKFFLPQWVAFDREGKLLVGSVAEAEADISSMQHFLQILHTAVGLAAYFIADAEYQRKRTWHAGPVGESGPGAGRIIRPKKSSRPSSAAPRPETSTAGFRSPCPTSTIKRCI